MNGPAASPLAPRHQPVERDKRRAVSLRGHAVLPGGAIVEVMVEDLSYDGCKIRTATPLKPGETIRLGVLERGMIEAQVRWSSNGSAGLVFDPEVDDPDEQRQERQTERVPLLADVTMRRLGKISYRVRVFDASTHGCNIEFIERPAINELVRIKIDGLQPLDARTCWIENHRAGFQFDRPIHPAVFDLLVSQMQTSRKGA